MVPLDTSDHPRAKTPAAQDTHLDSGLSHPVGGKKPVCDTVQKLGASRSTWAQSRRESHPSLTFHLALAKFFSIWAQTPSLMFLSEAALPEILERVKMCPDLKG